MMDDRLDPIAPVDEDAQDEWSLGDAFALADGEVVVEVEQRGGPIDLRVTGSSLPLNETVWTVAYWARNSGIPGTWKERVRYQGDTWRLGALYRYAGFEFRDRETNYREYGEAPEYDT